MRIGALALVTLLACSGGAPSKVKGAPGTPPDESYELGAVGYQRGFVWKCIKGERVHVWCGCGELVGCGKWALDRGPCGAPLASEPPAADQRPMTHGTWE